MPAMSNIHPVLQAYMARHGLDGDAVRPGGRLALDFDDRFRVHVRPASEGRVALTASLADMTLWAGSQAEAMLLRLASKAAGLARSHACSLVIDESLDSLQLQQVLPANAGVDALDRELGQFVNALEFWQRICSEEAGRRAD